MLSYRAVKNLAVSRLYQNTEKTKRISIEHSLSTTRWRFSSIACWRPIAITCSATYAASFTRSCRTKQGISRRQQRALTARLKKEEREREIYIYLHGPPATPKKIAEPSSELLLDAPLREESSKNCARSGPPPEEKEHARPLSWLLRSRLPIPSKIRRCQKMTTPLDCKKKSTLRKGKLQGKANKKKTREE